MVRDILGYAREGCILSNTPQGRRPVLFRLQIKYTYTRSLIVYFPKYTRRTVCISSISNAVNYRFVSTADSAKDHVWLRDSPVLGRRRMGPSMKEPSNVSRSVLDGVSSCRFKTFSALFLQTWLASHTEVQTGAVKVPAYIDWPCQKRIRRFIEKAQCFSH